MGNAAVTVVFPVTLRALIVFPLTLATFLAIILIHMPVTELAEPRASQMKMLDQEIVSLIVLFAVKLLQPVSPAGDILPIFRVNAIFCNVPQVFLGMV
jgi:hypothetical protein